MFDFVSDIYNSVMEAMFPPSEKSYDDTKDLGYITVYIILSMVIGELSLYIFTSNYGLPWWYPGFGIGCLGFIILSLSALSIYRDYKWLVFMTGINMMIFTLFAILVSAVPVLFISIGLLVSGIFCAVVAYLTQTLARVDWPRFVWTGLFSLGAVSCVVGGLCMAIPAPVFLPEVVLLFEVLTAFLSILALGAGGFLPVPILNHLDWNEFSNMYGPLLALILCILFLIGSVPTGAMWALA